MPPEANGNGDEGTNKGGSGKALPEEIRATLQDFFATNNIADREKRIFHQNAKLRHKNAELRARNEQLEASAPKDGAAVLTKADVDELAAYRALKLKPAELTVALTEHEKLKAKDAERSDEELYADAAETLGFENVALFTRMLKREGLHLEFQDVREKDDEGKTVVTRMPMVRPKADDKKALEPLPDYLEREVPEIIPVLQAEVAGADDDEEQDDDASDVQTRAPLRRMGSTRSRERSTEQTYQGVAIPLTRGARPSTGSARDDKREREALAKKRSAGGYGL